MKYILSILLVLPCVLFAQETKQVEILNADKLQFQTLEDGTSVRKLVGDVKLQQETTLMFCDSAYLFKEDNTLRAYGNVHIQEQDSVDVYSNTLLYNGNTKKAKLEGDARLTDGDVTLVSDTIFYDLNTKIGSYTEDGVITTDSTVLTSERGYYYANTKTAHFSENVNIVDPAYELNSDTLQFNTNTKVAYFYGPTTIYNDSSTIYCNLGSYDTNRELATFGRGTIIYNGPQTLYADSLYYERDRGYGKAMKYFHWNDKEMDAAMSGSRAEYFENEDKIIAYDRPVLVVKMEEDTLFLSGDVVSAKENEALDAKEFVAFPKVRMYKSDLQGVCDSMYYTFSDSVFRMFRQPILWSNQSEMKGDTIYAQVEGESIDRIEFRRNGMIVTQSAGKLFDQVKGVNITGYFRNQSLHKLLSNQNAESLYFGKNDADEYIGSNLVNATKMWIYMQDNEIAKISFIGKSEAVFTPMTKMNEPQYYLPDFQWNGELRPKNRNDL